ncbi:MAG: copper amine oxidase N-terminal domain-containing protein [Clostridia bacterium]|nr:copper amine oxidase N-terminal domain-containing protein [Clostridia bacterium]
MKKRLFSFLLVCSVLLHTAPIFATDIQLVIDGNAITIPENLGSVREADERILIPVRFLAEHMGYKVDYSDSNMVNGTEVESATLTAPTGTTCLVMHNSLQMYVLPGPNETKGGPITMDTPAFIDETENRFYAPVRFLAQALNCSVTWDEETRTVSLDKQAQ